ncbi:hypothetical protein PCANC_02989 [Puccinia coronata f. sp. avenae]|uniref:DUF1279 domain-containing protein n=1 Tax=Puccinia coronata f. sp. avenae TaxID=200324 RepID=A0A2N5W156_9BASI|nr:hypothetical protein PCANC_02989 [Puccinia coronata f. sp. avenae]
MGNTYHRRVLQMDQLSLVFRTPSSSRTNPAAVFSSFLFRSNACSPQLSKRLLSAKPDPTSSSSPPRMVPAALFQKDSLNQKNYEHHLPSLHDSSRLRPSKTAHPISQSLSSSSLSSLPSSVLPSSSNAPSNLKLNPLDQYPKTSHSTYYSIRSFFTQFTNQNHDHSYPQGEKGSQFKTEQAPPVGLFGKLKQLTKLYGSAALVVYGLLGGVDFGLSFLTIYLVGAEQVRRVEDWLLEQLNWKRVHSSPALPDNTPSSAPEPAAGTTDANMLWTTAVVAYTIHKTILLPVRLGLTAWITPPLVRHLRKRGWKVGRNLE